MCFDREEERGSALVLTILIIASLVTFGTISMYSAADKYMQVTKERLQRQALHIADAGISQGAPLLKLDESDGFNDSELTAAYPEEDISVGGTKYDLHRWIDTVNISAGEKFKVWLADNDDTTYVSGRSNDTLSDDDNDRDRAVVLVSKGWIEDGAGNERKHAFVKGLFKRVPYDPEFALLTSGDIKMNGSISVTGSTPSIHTNSNLTSIGNADESEGAVTASGTMAGSVNLTGGGSTGTGNAPPVDIPAITTAYYRSIATSIVRDTADSPILDGTCERVPAAGSDCVEICNSGGSYTVSSPASGSHAICKKTGSNTNAGGVFYFDGPVEVDTTDAWAAVVLAAGTVTLKTGTIITGSSDLKGVGLVSDADFFFRGSVTIGSLFDQLGMYSVGSVDFGGGGNKDIYGPIITNGTIGVNSLSGNITLIYDNTSPPTNGPLIGKLISWSQVE